MISATMDAAAAVEKLKLWRERMRAGLREGFAQAAETLIALVRAKVSGRVLQTRSATLRASLRAELHESDGGFAARLRSDGSVPYARVQEYGGRIAIPGITASHAKALAFVYGGKMVFAKRAAPHMIDIPERSYMRSSLQEFAPVLVDVMRKLAAEVSR